MRTSANRARARRRITRRCLRAAAAGAAALAAAKASSPDGDGLGPEARGQYCSIPMDSAAPFVAKEKAVLQSDPIFTLTDGAHRQGAGSGVASATQARRALRRSLPDVPAAHAGVSPRAAAAPQPLATE